MLRRKRPSSDEKDAPARKRRGRLRTALTDAGWAVREHVFWRFGDALRHGGDLIKWPFERAAWAVRRGLFWRVGDRFAALGPVTRGATFGLIILVVAGAGVTGLLLATPDRTTEQASTVAAVVAEPDPAAAPAAKPQPDPKPQPTLQGAAPLFTPESESSKGKKSSGGDRDSSSSSTTTSSSGSGQPQPLASVLSSSGPKPAAATTSTSARKDQGKSAVAGPKAIEVAREFAAAFVLYETGRGDKEVRKTFAETTAPELRQSLLRRPPRLPANVKVPKAKVLNVVPGPAHGGVYTVSVALLRVGLTSELRLDMEPGKGKRWQVTNILG
jgi:hypothetical protein